MSETDVEPHQPPGQAGLFEDGVAGTSTLGGELRAIHDLVATARREDASGSRPGLPGQAWFLPDGRVVCGDRARGDSRVPYGRRGFNFWVNASGRMHANDGLYFLFLPTRPGQDPPIAFFAGHRAGGSKQFTPTAVLPVPFLAAEAGCADRYTVLGCDAAYFVTRGPALDTALRVFVEQPVDAATQIVFSLRVASRSGETLDVFTSAYLDFFCRHQFAETHEDRWFKKIAVADAAPEVGKARESERELAPFLVAVNEDVDRFQSVENHAQVRRVLACMSDHPNGGTIPRLSTTQVCTSQRDYHGSMRRGLGSAAFLTTGAFADASRLTVFNENAIAGDLLRFDMPPGGAVEIHYVVGLPPNARGLASFAAQRMTPATVTSMWVRHRAMEAAASGSLDITVEGSAHADLDAVNFNHFLPFLKKQVEVCAQVRGYMQPSPNSLIGIRDVFQAIEGHLYDKPDDARAKILEALDYVLIDGRCPRQYSLPVNGQPGRADLREFVDQGLWVISAVYSYVCVTGDVGLLEQEAGYHRVDPRDEQALVETRARDSVLAHLLRIMDFFTKQLDAQTGLLRALYGDWNDALDGLGTTREEGVRFGSGVSVMATLQLYRNCAEMIELLERFGRNRYAGDRVRIATMRTALKEGLLRHAVVQSGTDRRILHGWGDQRSYLVGSFADSDHLARDGLTSNAFWVLSGMLEADPSLRADILAAFDRLDSPYGLTTFAPGFQPHAPGVGRISKLPIGTAENGASYLHATLFGVLALFAMGEPRRAWEQIIKILPFTPRQQGISHSPFVMPNSYVVNAELNLSGQNMNDWQTGSSNVLLKTLVRDVFGFQPQLERLKIVPAAWSPFERMTLDCRPRGRRLTITILGSRADPATFLLNGARVPVLTDSERHCPSVLLDYEQLAEDRANHLVVQ